MSILFNILLFLHVVVCLLLVLLVMMQRPKQEGLGAAFASGMMSESFGAHTTDVLQKGTRFLAICFFSLSILLAVIKAKQNQNWVAPVPPEPSSQVETPPAGTETPLEMPKAPTLGDPGETAVPEVPSTGVPASETPDAGEKTAPAGDAAPAESGAAEGKPAEETTETKPAPPKPE